MLLAAWMGARASSWNANQIEIKVKTLVKKIVKRIIGIKQLRIKQLKCSGIIYVVHAESRCAASQGRSSQAADMRRRKPLLRRW